MALKRWLGAALIVSVFGFVGCTEPVKKDDSSTTTTETTSVTVVETPVEVAETPVEMAETPSETPGDTAATPADGATVAVAGGSEILEDLENAEGMTGYEEVKAMTVPPSSPEVVARGKELYAANCALCHGEKGLGDGAGGANLDPPPRNLTLTDEYKYGHLELALFRTGNYGIDGTGMAPWDGIIEPADQWAIGHYIRTLQK